MKLRKRNLVAGFYLLALHVLAVALVAKVDAVPKIVASVEMMRVRSDFGARVGDHDPRPLMFIGDSITQNIGPIPHARNYGATGSTTTDMLGRLSRLPLRKASGIFLMIGTNDLWFGKVRGLPERLGGIAAALPADVPLVWSGIPPTGDVRIDPDDVLAANETIRALCAARPGCTYIDTWALLGKNGKALPENFVTDGIHPSPRGYELWLSALATEIARLDREGNP